jgi:hypothetical protein
MTQSDDWESVDYHNLPHWLKRVSKPNQWVKKTYTKIFYSKPYDYKVEYAVIHGKLRISYWRSLSTKKPHPIIVKERSSHQLNSLHYLLIFLIFTGVCFVVLTQFNSINNPPTSEISAPIITGTQPTITLTPLKTSKITPSITPSPTTDYRKSPKTTPYPYVIDGSRKSISFTTYGGLSDYFSEKSHTYRYNPNEVIMALLENDYQNENLQPLVETIRKSSTNPDNQAKIAISLVQHIPYNWNKYYGTSMDWYYPYETLYNDRGVCADKSLLLAYLLNELGYDTVLFEFSGHMAVGVKGSPNYGFYNTGYAFIETTRPTITTYIPDTYLSGFKVSSNPNIIHLNGGKKVLDVSNEYRDAVRLKQLEGMGTVLDQTNYAEWLRISNNYNLQYDT